MDESRLDELSDLHTQLKVAVASEHSHLGSDDLHLAELKKEKLRIKDEIARMERADHAA